MGTYNPIGGNSSNAASQPAAAAQPSTNYGPRLFTTGNLFSAPLSRNGGGEYLKKLKDRVSEIIAAVSPEVKVELLTLESDANMSFAFSCLLITLKQKAAPQLGVAFHTLILEATGEPLSPITDIVNNVAAEVLRPASEAYDLTLMQAAQNLVLKANPGLPAHVVDACVVPRHFNLDDLQRIRDLVLNALMATNTHLCMLVNPDINLINCRDNLNTKTNPVLSINLSFSKTQIEDIVGRPMRSDVIIDFKSQVSNGQKEKSVNGVTNEIKLSQLSGFIDLVPLKRPAYGGPYQPVNPYGIMNAPKAYAARFIITDVSSDYSQTPAGILLALATSISVSRDSNWMTTFKPSMYSDKNTIDLHDIGALNYETKINPDSAHELINTKTEKLEELSTYIRALVDDRIFVSLDCPIAAPQSWYLSLFLEAANGHRAAIDTIINAADSLTNNNFSNIFKDPTIAIFTDLGNHIHNGWWTDKSGLKRDIRDFDHLAVCNLVGKKNPQFIKEWSDTFLKTNYPIAIRLSARRKMISNLSNESAVFTGFSQRITFTSAFMSALNQAIMATGVGVQINNNQPGLDFQDQHYYANFAAGAMIDHAAGTFMEHRTGFGTQENNYNRYYHFNRFK